MKKILMIIFILVNFLFIKTNTYAADLEYTCDYMSDDRFWDVKLQGVINIYSDGQENTYVSDYYNNDRILDSSEDILNWDNAIYGTDDTDLGYEGKASYLKEKKCPEWMIYVFLPKPYCDLNCERIFVSPNLQTTTQMMGTLGNLKQWKGNYPIVISIKLSASTVPTTPGKDSKPKPIIVPDGNIDFCGDEGVIKTSKFVGYIIYVIKILVPLALILFGSIDFIKAIIESDSNKIKNSGVTLAKRTIAGIIIFFIPTIISLALSLISSFDKDMKKDYERCYKCIKKPYDC